MAPDLTCAQGEQEGGGEVTAGALEGDLSRWEGGGLGDVGWDRGCGLGSWVSVSGGGGACRRRRRRRRCEGKGDGDALGPGRG
jgi:hypothetical protein